MGSHVISMPHKSPYRPGKLGWLVAFIVALFSTLGTSSKATQAEAIELFSASMLVLLAVIYALKFCYINGKHRL